MLASHEIGRGSDDNLAVRRVEYGDHPVQGDREGRRRRRDTCALLGAQEPQQCKSGYHIIILIIQITVTAAQDEIHIGIDCHLQPDIV